MVQMLLDESVVDSLLIMMLLLFLVSSWRGPSDVSGR